MKQENKVKIIEDALRLVLNANKKGISNYKIAKDTNIAEKTIGNYINGKSKPSFANANILMKYFTDDFKEQSTHSNITITTGGHGKNINASTGSGAISNSSRDTSADTNIITELQAKIKELENELEKRDLIIQGLKNDIGTKDLLISVLMKER